MEGTDRAEDGFAIAALRFVSCLRRNDRFVRGGDNCGSG